MPSVDKDEVLVKVRLAAICGTDLELARGYYGSHVKHFVFVCQSNHLL